MNFTRNLIALLLTSFLGGVIAVAQCNVNNLISSNPSFENNFTDWNPRTAAGVTATFNTINTTATDGNFSAEIIVPNIGGNFWDIQIKRSTISLTGGVTYVLTFDAKKSVGTEDMRFGLNTINGNNGITNSTAPLTDAWQSFSHTFTHATTEDVSLFFNYGDIIGTFYLDNVKVQEFCPAVQSLATFCKTLNVPGINGSEGMVWTPAIQYDLNQSIEGSAANASDFSAYYKTIWDKENLIFVVNVSDDILKNDSPTGLESFDDGVEIYLDIGNDKNSAYDTDDHHFLFRWNDPTIYHISAGQINPTGAIADFDNTVNGYTFEILLPWSLLGNGVQGNIIGIDVQVNDDDDGGDDREARIGWNATSINVNSDPSLFGEGRLDLTPCTRTLQEYEPFICSDLPDTVYHSSGLIVSEYGTIWTHNDKQGQLAPPLDSQFFEIDANGDLVREVYLTDFPNVDWEDMTQDKDGNMYVGEFGSGNSPYTDLHIYKIKNPFYFCETDYVVEEINFRYPAGASVGDTESMFYWNGDIYLIPKNNKSDAANPKAGKAEIYKIPAIPNAGSQYTASLLYTIDLNPNYPAEPIDQYKVASADLSPDGQTLVMMWGRRFWLVTDFTPGIFLDGTITTINMPDGLFWQREAVAFADNNTIFTIDENNAKTATRGKLGKIEVCDILPDHPSCACDEQLTTDVAESSMDSAEEYTNGNVNNGSSDLELTYDSGATGNQIIGLRFSNLGIPQGAPISEAYIQFVVDETDISQASDLTIWGQASTNAPAFVASSKNISQRPKTMNSVNWSFANWTVKDVAYTEHRTADISNIIQELVNKNNWSEDNALAFIIEGKGSQTAKRHVGCDGSGPRLWVRYCTNESSCASTLSILNQTIPSDVYQSGMSINSNGQVISPANVEFRSDVICMDPDFEVGQGATFHALIDPCL